MNRITGEAAIQGSDAWKEWRKGLRTASKAWIVAKGTDAQKRQFAKERLGLVPDYTSAAMQHGTDTEPEARAWAEIQLGKLFEPACFQLGVYGVSLDGWNDDGHILEIKCPYSENSEILAAARRGEIYEPHLYQMCQQYAVSSASEAHWIVYYKDERYIKRFVFDPVMWADIKRGWDLHDSDYMTKDYSINTDIQLANAAGGFIDCGMQIEALKKKQEEHRKVIIEKMAEGGKAFGITVARKSPSKGAIDYSKVPELVGVDLEPYRKAAGTDPIYAITIDKTS